MARPWLDALLVFEHDIPETQHERIFGDAILHPFLVQFGVMLQPKLFVFDESVRWLRLQELAQVRVLLRGSSSHRGTP